MNCKPGDLAITVRADLAENLGKIVRVVSYGGRVTWAGFREPTCLWRVTAASEACSLVYKFADGERVRVLSGLVPDVFLRPIRPPSGESGVTEECHLGDARLENNSATIEAR
jgi:hypothetical protein